jgi:hypothetical protein
MKKILLSAAISMASLSVSALEIIGTEVVDLYGSESFVTVHDSATVNTHETSNIAFLWGVDNSTVNVDGGEISWLHAYDRNVTNISFINDLSWLLVRDNSVVNIYGSNFNYSGGHLSGTWSNGNHFEFWALKENDLSSGNIGNILPNNIILHSASVPEPASLSLFLIGFIILTAKRFNKRLW